MIRGVGRAEVCVTEADQAVVRGVGRVEVCVTEAAQDMSREDTADASAVNNLPENSKR